MFPWNENRNEGTFAKTTLLVNTKPPFCLLVMLYEVLCLVVVFHLGIAKPMVCMRVALHENDGNHENDRTTKTTQAATKKELCWISGNHGNDKNPNPGTS